MKKTETNLKKNVATNVITRAINSSETSNCEKLFFTYADQLVKAKLDLTGKTNQMLATIKPTFL